MKKIYILFSIFAVLSTACSRDNVEPFSGTRQIFFDKFYMNEIAPGTEEADSTTATFFFLADEIPSLKVQLAVQLSGDLLTEDLTFGLRAVMEESTAKENAFALADSYTFRARPVPAGEKEVRDTIEVTLKRCPELTAAGEKGLRLVVELVPNENVGLGQYERRRAVIVWTDTEAKPDWWTAEVTHTLLGEYSKDKFLLFLEVVEGADQIDSDFVSEHPAKVIDMVNQFKAWLNEHLDDPDKGLEYLEILESII